MATTRAREEIVQPIVRYATAVLFGLFCLSAAAIVAGLAVWVTRCSC